MGSNIADNRRDFIKKIGFGLSLPLLGNQMANNPPKLKGNLKQVIAAWPFMAAGPKWSAEQFLANTKALGVVGVELFPVEKWALLKQHNLICAATKSHTFVRGMNNRNHHSECFTILEKAIKATGDAGFPNVMTFTGLLDTSQEQNGSKVSFEEGRKNCIEGYKKIVQLAEKRSVTLVLEPLNTKVTENMKGHPGYQGDHIDFCVDIIKTVGSPSLKLLFDVYHIQIMDGDLIRHIQQYQEYIGHVQVAGVPGRGEIGTNQEINYPAVMKAFLDIGYRGYVGHEWIPTGGAMEGLKEAVNICDI